MIEEFRLLRVHLTEDDARALVVQDLVAFRRAFPGAIIEINEQFLREYFADIMSYGYVVRVKVTTDDQTWEKMKAWHARLKAAIVAENRVRLNFL